MILTILLNKKCTFNVRNIIIQFFYIKCKIPKSVKCKTKKEHESVLHLNQLILSLVKYRETEHLILINPLPYHVHLLHIWANLVVFSATNKEYRTLSSVFESIQHILSRSQNQHIKVCFVLEWPKPNSKLKMCVCVCVCVWKHKRLYWIFGTDCYIYMTCHLCMFADVTEIMTWTTL